MNSADADGDGNADGDIDCPLLGGRACRSNLKDISTRDFKALSDGIWKYKYKKCTDNCEIIFLKFIQWPWSFPELPFILYNSNMFI